MKATGIVRRIDDLGRVVIPKEIRRTMRIREGDPPQITLTQLEKYIIAVNGLGKKQRDKKDEHGFLFAVLILIGKYNVSVFLIL